MLTPTSPQVEIFSADQQDLVELLKLARSYLVEASNIAQQYRQNHPQLATDCADAVHHTVEALGQLQDN